MAKLYFAKLNINSNINQIKKTEINKILERLYEAIDDKKDYVKDVPVKYIDENNEEQVTIREERYNFSQIDKDDESKIVTGWIVRRMPTFIEEFDNKERVSTPTVYDNTSASTMFYLNCEKEIITFTIKNRLRQLQIMDALEGLFGNYIKEVGFKVFLINNPFDIDETLRRMKKVHKISTTLIPPNAANRAALERLMKEKSKELKSANVTSETIIWESDKKNSKGLNKKSKRFRDLINVVKAFTEKGYGKTEIEGENSEGKYIDFDSNDNAPYIENISDVNKEDRNTVINVSNEGIKRLALKSIVKKLRTQK